MIPITLRASRAFAAAALAAGLIGGMSFVSSYAAEPTASSESMRDARVQRFNEHLQAHLDKLAARLEIKASQEEAWKAFSAAFRNVMVARVAAPTSMGAPEADAASLARKQAERAAEHAQQLERLADATAKLQQGLSADQRLVFNDVAHDFARARFARFAMGHGRWEHGSRCEGADRGRGHSRWEHRGGDRDGGEHGSGMDGTPGASPSMSGATN
ncbi:exported hypothetical protein [Burkholderiales bacterium]|jgi:hypothetical protein|nr:exported hypothetical protein [Burkholderiales bacterium]